MNKQAFLIKFKIKCKHQSGMMMALASSEVILHLRGGTGASTMVPVTETSNHKLPFQGQHSPSLSLIINPHPKSETNTYVYFSQIY